MKHLDVTLLLSLLGAFVLSCCGFTSGDDKAGLCGLCLMFLLGAMNIVNLLLEIRNSLGRR